MGTMKKRLLSCLMVLALTCSLLPASVLAEEVKNEPSVPAAGEAQQTPEQETGPAEAEDEPEQAGPEETEESEKLEETEEPPGAAEVPACGRSGRGKQGGTSGGACG